MAEALYKCWDYNDIEKKVLETYLDGWQGIFHLYEDYLFYGWKE